MSSDQNSNRLGGLVSVELVGLASSLLPVLFSDLRDGLDSLLEAIPWWIWLALSLWGILAAAVQRIRGKLAYRRDWTCPSCGMTNAGGSGACHLCGALHPERSWTCEVCDEVNPDDVTVCSHCSAEKSEPEPEEDPFSPF